MAMVGVGRKESTSRDLYPWKLLWHSPLLRSVLLYLHHCSDDDGFTASQSLLLIKGVCLSECLSTVRGKRVER